MDGVNLSPAQLLMGQRLSCLSPKDQKKLSRTFKKERENYKEIKRMYALLTLILSLLNRMLKRFNTKLFTQFFVETPNYIKWVLNK